VGFSFYAKAQLKKREKSIGINIANASFGKTSNKTNDDIP
jgi:hypothetical protein